ncbi:MULTISPECIES: tautomerase family protein [Oceanobacillus]|uniref:4-oxalocrotonate tautomerase family protein n=1 Tax=Oceanobacillus aidingensis TaxID=645964 RepID=A0ABV9JSJ3_9BACI|nr:tautomerase family protein [Oceanobacillus oncorhynchi]UUI39915.1 tautomerase family protein [Oceanobacillus oncorhynchi]
MPYIKLKLVEGRDLETKRLLVSNITKAVIETLQTTPDNVRVELIEINEDLFSIGGELMIDKNN